jgi:DNA-binding winged helix-turn-helix (wHTH) protein
MGKEINPAEKFSATTRSGGVILFGDFRLVPSTRALTKGPTPVHLGARALDILTALIDRAGQVVSNSELLAMVWPKYTY